MFMKKKIKLLFVLGLILLALSSCNTTPGKFDRVMTSIAGTGNLKHYIRPTEIRSVNYAKDKAYALIDFSYQKNNQDYVSDAYTNFSINYKNSDFVESSSFILDTEEDAETVKLFEITTFDRDSSRGYIRIGTILKKDDVGKVLKLLSMKKAKLRIVFVNKDVLIFEASDDLVESIKMAFQR